MAGALTLKDCQFNFDSHITKITYGSGWTTNTSGSTFSGNGPDMSGTYTVELENGYVIDTVTITEGTLDSKTDNSFTITVNRYDATTIVNITSKQQTSSSGETWLLNESLIDTTSEMGFNASIGFTSNNETFTSISLLLRAGREGVQLEYGSTTVYNSIIGSGWTNQAYRTINFAKPPSGDLLTWLQENGTKQGSTPTYKFKHWKKSNVVVNRTLVGQKYYYFKPYTILGLYTITTTLTNCTGASANSTKIQENGGLTLTFTANSGYELPTGVSVTNVTSYNWNKTTGVLAISKPTGDVTIEIVAVSALPQLTTPTNVAVTDTTLTFDEVANATSYEVFVDNVSIGTHSIVTGHTLTFGEDLEVKVNGTSITSPYTLTQNCTITASNTNYSDVGATPPSVTVNNTAYNNSTTVSISGTDVNIENTNRAVGLQFPWGQITVTINYTA